MKHPTILSILCAASLVGSGTSLVAQADNRPDRPDGPPSFEPGRGHPPGKKGKYRGEKPILSPDDAQRLKAAHEKVKGDPAIQSLKEQRDAIEAQLVKAMNAALLAADPTLAPVLDKVQNARKNAKETRKAFESLTPEQKESLKAARESIKDDPAVSAARAKMKAATTPEAKQQAEQELHAARKAALLQKNPALAPLLEKLGPPPGRGAGERKVSPAPTVPKEEPDEVN